MRGKYVFFETLICLILQISTHCSESYRDSYRRSCQTTQLIYLWPVAFCKGDVAYQAWTALWPLTYRLETEQAMKKMSLCGPSWPKVMMKSSSDIAESHEYISSVYCGIHKKLTEGPSNSFFINKNKREDSVLLYFVDECFSMTFFLCIVC